MTEHEFPVLPVVGLALMLFALFVAAVFAIAYAA